MKSLLSFLIISFIIMAGCSGQEESAEQISYSSLPELQVDLVIEAGESDAYFPSNLNDLFVAPDGSIIVSDWGSDTLEQFSEDGEHQKTIATKGGGPGELPDVFYLKDAGDGRLIVEHPRSRLDFFVPGEDTFYRYDSTISLDANGSMDHRVVGKRSADDYYAVRVNLISDVQSLIINPRDYRDEIMVIVDESLNLVQDSIAVLKTPLPHLTDAGNGAFRVDMVPYRNRDRFLTLQNGDFLTARPDPGMIELYDRDLNAINKIELDVVPREISSSDLEYAFRNHRDEVVRDIEPRMHDFKPPFLDILASENRLWLHTDNSEVGKEFVLLEMDGTPVGKFLLSEFDEVKKAIDNRIYTIHKNPDIGHSLRIYEVAI